MGKNKPRSQKNEYKFKGMIDSNGLCRNYYNDNQCWNEYVEGPHPYHYGLLDEQGKLKCKGNRFVCLKLKYKWWASLSDKFKNKLLQKYNKKV